MRTSLMRAATAWRERRRPTCIRSCPRSRTKMKRMPSPFLMRNRTPFVSSHKGAAADIKLQRKLSAAGYDVARDLERDYRAHGVKVIEDLRKNEPWNYLRLILSLVP